MPREYRLRRADTDLPAIAEGEDVWRYSNAPDLIIGWIDMEGVERQVTISGTQDVQLVAAQLPPDNTPLSRRIQRTPFGERLHYWKLDGKTPVPCTMEEYATEMETNDGHIIMRDEIPVQDGHGGGYVIVSTIFLGLDHSMLGVGPPVLFETMIFGGEHDEYQRRYTDFDEAVQGHKEALDMVRLSL